MRLLSVLLLAALVGCADAPADAGSSADGAAATPTGPPIVDVASAEALVDDLDGLEAELVVLNFWATWCGPCRAEFPEFVRYDAEAPDGVHVRFVSLDQPTARPMVQSFLAEYDVDDPSYLYTGQGDVTSQLNPFVGNALPITMLLDGEGIVQHTHVGRLTYDALVQTVADVQAGRTPTTS
ncbi:TlpA family protein disulfide reductase [Rubrivirga sp. IMCC45206]|uniref:TlpA family protein disulfide reductase n=1 Tax=Rubrivirga sp. IMCC45206 TaxID=3391614 RepID=UPI00398FD49E